MKKVKVTLKSGIVIEGEQRDKKELYGANAFKNDYIFVRQSIPHVIKIRGEKGGKRETIVIRKDYKDACIFESTIRDIKNL